MSWWYEPWLGEMESTVGVEQAVVLKKRPDVSLDCWQCGEATHSWFDLETRRDPAGGKVNRSGNNG